MDERELRREHHFEQVLRGGVLRAEMSIFAPWAMKDKAGKLVGFHMTGCHPGVSPETMALLYRIWEKGTKV